MIQHRPDVVRSARLRIFSDILRHIGWRIAARIIGDGPMPLTEMPHLRFPAPVIAGVFMHKDHRPTGARLFIVEPNPVIRRCVWHGYLPFSSSAGGSSAITVSANELSTASSYGAPGDTNPPDTRLARSRS